MQKTRAEDQFPRTVMLFHLKVCQSEGEKNVEEFTLCDCD